MAKYVFKADDSIRRISEIKKEMMRLIKKEDGVVVDLGQLERIDTAVAQVIIAAHKEAKKRNKHFRISNIHKNISRQLYLCAILKSTKE